MPPWLVLTAALIAQMVCSVAGADLIELSQGRIRAGRITRQTDAMIRLETGSAAADRAGVVEFARSDVEVVHIGRAEVEKIDECGEAALLRDWAAGYFHCGLDVPAMRCVRRTVAVDPATVPLPPENVNAAFRAFWNRGVIAELSSGPAGRDAAGLLNLAKLAYRADLSPEAAALLKRVWRADYGNREARNLAKKWDVRLPPPLTFDLTPALAQPLLVGSIEDERALVPAGQDRQFLILPFRLDANLGRPYSRSLFRGRSQRGLYGFRVLRSKDGRPDLKPIPRAPIYERIEAARPSGRGSRFVGRNTNGPRAADGSAGRLRPTGPRERPVAGSGWAAVVVDVATGASTVRIEYSGGASEAINLSILRRASERRPSGLLDGESASLRRWLDRLSGGASERHDSSSVAVVMIGQLARLRLDGGLPLSDAWHARVEAAVVGAALTRGEAVGPAAVGFLTISPGLRDSTKDLIAGLTAEQQLRWCQLIESSLGLPLEGDRGPRLQPGATRVDRFAASGLIGPVLAGTDRAAIACGLSILVRLGTDADWGVLESSSATARRLALGRLEWIEDAAVGRRMLAGLMAGAESGSLDRLSRLAGRLNLGAGGAIEPLLRRWSRLSTEAERVGLLTVLSSTALDSAVYGAAFSKLVEQATARSAPQTVREAAFALVAAQAGRLYRSDRGVFGLIVPRDTSDPMVVGLTRALGSRRESTRRSAAEILLGAGFAEEVVRGLGKRPATEREASATFAEVFRLADGGSPDAGVVAAMGHLLGSESETVAGSAANLLTRTTAGVDPANRWLVRAAIKSAVDMPALTARTLSKDGAVAGGCIRRLFDVAHLTRQERQRFLAAGDLSSRLSQLADADFRRGRLVDGRYGAVAVVETVVASGTSKTGVRWAAPKRRAVVLPPVVLALNPKDDGYSVSWTGGVLGGGLALSQRPIGRSPAYYYGLMEAMGAAAFMRPDSKDNSPIGDGGVTVVGGPLVLKSGAATDTPEPGTMRLEIADWLRAALEAASAADGKSPSRKPPASFIPADLILSLRYTRFGGYCGTLPRRSLPTRASAGDRHLLNVMLILERME